MIVEHVHNGIRYTLTNDNLVEGDLVFPIARGRCLDDGGWILHEFDYRDFMSGFPDNPHTLVDLKYDTYKPYEVRTDKGYSPKEKYYKIIKREEQIKENDRTFSRYKWKEI